MMKKTMMIMVTLITLVMIISCSNSAGFIPDFEDYIETPTDEEKPVDTPVVTPPTEEDTSIVTTVATPTYIRTNDKVTLSSTSGATIYYTLDSSEPSESSTEYTGEITLTAKTTIKAIAIKSGLSSEIFNEEITPKVATPTAVRVGGWVKLSTTTDGSTIVFTKDGTDPEMKDGEIWYGTDYVFVEDTGVELKTWVPHTTLKTLAYKAGYEDSDVATFEYDL
jgi:hypothetical protein